jgi:hypothetical protein
MKFLSRSAKGTSEGFAKRSLILRVDIPLYARQTDHCPLEG